MSSNTTDVSENTTPVSAGGIPGQSGQNPTGLTSSRSTGVANSVPTARTGLSNRPNFTNYVKSQTKTKNDSGITLGNPFNKRYYSQCDAELYFGDTFIDEIVDIRFAEQQASQPLTGYNSYTYDEVAQGARIIQGTFSVNFTSPGYLNTVLSSMVVINQKKSAATVVKSAPEGTPAEKKTATSAAASTGAKWAKTFDIDIVYGQKTSLGDTVHIVLNGVVITGYNSGLDVSGKVALETYSFLAKDITTVG